MHFVSGWLDQQCVGGSPVVQGLAITKRERDSPFLFVRTALMVLLRPPRRSIFSAIVNAWAMFVKSFLYPSLSVEVLTFAI